MSGRSWWRLPGCRVAISSMEHSPMTTRVYGSTMTRHTGIVISVMRDGLFAFVRLDGPESDLPQGIRRWVIHWDDLTEVCRQSGESEPRKRDLQE